jgi:ethanolaminephosphotransferase
MYSTMDNVDGKQARRTGTSSGLGELFEFVFPTFHLFRFAMLTENSFSHGIDSLNCTLASLCETGAMSLGPTPAGIFTALIPCLPMFFSTWETYHTHTLYLGYFNGPTEGLILACSIMVLSGVYGPELWTYRIADLPILNYPEIFGDYSLRDLWVPIILTSFFVAHLPACIKHVISARRAQNLPVLSVFWEWTPIVVYSSSIFLWLSSPYSTLMPRDPKDYIENRLVLFCLTMSFVFGRMTTKIILAHLTRRPFPYWTVMLIPLIGGALLGNLPRFGLPAVSKLVELWYLRAYFVFALVAYFRWATLVINRICSVLDINCLTIKKKSKAKEDGDLEGTPRQKRGTAFSQTPNHAMETRRPTVLRESVNGDASAEKQSKKV